MAWLEFQTASGGAILRRQLFTANGTWTKSADIVGDQVFITAIGGGAGGFSSGAGGGGGGGGSWAGRFPVDVSSTSSEAVTIGAGGASDNAGSTTSFGAILSLSGGASGGARVGAGGASGGASGVGDGDIGGGGGGQVLDASEISAATGTFGGGGGGYGYGSGGGSGSNSGGAGAPGAVLVEWMEKV